MIFYFCCIISLHAAEYKTVYKNGVLQAPKHANGTQFDKENMWHLNDYLRTYPVYKPNDVVVRTVRDFKNDKDVEAVIGWSCTFENGLCDGWNTTGQILKRTCQNVNNMFYKSCRVDTKIVVFLIHNLSRRNITSLQNMFMTYPIYNNDFINKSKDCNLLTLLKHFGIIKTDITSMIDGATELRVRNLTNWYLGRGNNQMSVHTGPAIDHTRMATFGTFLQTQNSVTDSGKAYVLFTQSIDLLYYKNYCLSFWHHSMGDRRSKPASLRVLINKSELGSTKWQTLFLNHAVVSDSKIDWKYAQLNIRIRNLNMPAWKNTFFAFISTRGDSYASDIALDDIQLRPEICQG